MKFMKSFVIMSKISFLILTSISLTSCSRGVDVLVTENSDKTIFTMKKGSFLEFGELCFNRIEVLKGEDTVWSFYSPNNCIGLKSLTYGDVPNGFSEIVKSQKLISGREYLIVARGYGWYGEHKWISGANKGLESR